MSESSKFSLGFPNQATTHQQIANKRVKFMIITIDSPAPITVILTVDQKGSEHTPLKVPNVKFSFDVCVEAQTSKLSTLKM